MRSRNRQVTTLHLTRSHSDHLRDHSVDLKRVPPKSLPTTATPNRLLHPRKRPARTSPSTFLFLPIHLSNSPEPRRSPPRIAQGAVEAQTTDRDRRLVTEYQ